MTRSKPELLPEAEGLFQVRLSEPDQRLVRADGVPLSVELFQRYWPTGQARPARCPVCLRIYDATPVGNSHQAHGYCSTHCRSWAADRRRRVHPRQWLTCAECGLDLFALDERAACPPVAPVSWSDASDCRKQRKLRLDAEACRRWRQRSSPALTAGPAEQGAVA